jgi:hypothetical protein
MGFPIYSFALIESEASQTGDRTSLISSDVLVLDIKLCLLHFETKQKVVVVERKRLVLGGRFYIPAIYSG